jgi:subtilisin family serine protease/PKD repeat protein
MKNLRAALLWSIVLMGLHLSAQDTYRYKLTVQLNDQASSRQNQWLDVYIALEKQLDYQAWNKTIGQQRISNEAKTKQLLAELRANARNTQGPLVAFLQSRGALMIKSYYIANAVGCRIPYSLLPELGSRSDVKWIGENLPLLPTDNSNVVAAPPAPNGRENGLTAIGAPEMWAMGYTGYGGIAFTADTGVDPTHPAIKSKYRGFTVGDQQGWYNYNGSDSSPFDCDQHGTHVTGTIIGLDRETKDTIGVAFNAQWIGGAILCGIGTEDNIGAFEWSINPDGDTATVNDIPHVINNSWYDPSLSGLDCYSVYVPVLEAMEAAGIAVIFSAGNEGPDPGTITQPHNINISELNAFTVGALNANTAALPIAIFSSKGPSHCDGEGSIKIKPEVSAPGVNVRSCIRDGQYGLLSGTSMAAPHVSGAVLLLREAFPYLRGRDFKEALYQSCIDLGEVGEDNTFGMGIINVPKAFKYLVDKGNQPVNPIAQNDIQLVDVKHRKFSCESSIYPLITVFNGGQDTIRSFDLVINDGQTTTTLTQSGIALAPQQSLEVEYAPLIVGVGKKEFRFTVINPNGEADDRDFNNTQVLSITVNDLPIEDIKLEVDQTGLCIGSRIILPNLSKPDEGIGTEYFESIFSEDVVFEGDKYFYTITRPTTIYAQRRFYETMENKISNGTELSAEKGLGLKFDVSKKVRLDSLTVYANVKGVRRFIIYNQDNDTIGDFKKFIKVGRNTFPVDVTIPAGEDNKIVMTEGLGLSVNTADVNFPYVDKKGVLTIHAATSGTAYPFFYEWQISHSDDCNRVPIKINANNTLTGEARFLLSTNVVTLPDATVNSTNLSKGAITHLWDTGDGGTYETENITHTYTAVGNYTVTYRLVDSAGCYAFRTLPLEVRMAVGVQDEELSDVTIYPVPVRDLLRVEGLILSEDTKMHIIDVSGKVRSEQTVDRSTTDTQVSTIDLQDGVYYLRWKQGQSVKYARFVKIAE